VTSFNINDLISFNIVSVQLLAVGPWAGKGSGRRLVSSILVAGMGRGEHALH